MTQPSQERLELLYRVAQTFNSSLDLGHVLDTVMDEVVAATRAERGFLMLFEPDGSLSFHAARGLDHQTIQSPEFQVSRGVVQLVAQNGQPLLTFDAQDDERLNQRESVELLGLRAVLCAPLTLKGQVQGVIYVDNRVMSGAFSEADLELLESIASSAAIAIENARLYQIAIDKGRMEQELQVAHDVQRSMIPRSTPVFPGWQFAALWKPARVVSGDLYDFVALGDHLGLVIADVSDKGMPAALFMAMTRSTVQGCLTPETSPAAGITQANRLVCKNSSDGMFVSLFLAQIDSSGKMVYVNGGHNPPIIYQAASGEFRALRRTGMALGFDPECVFSEEALQLEPGDFMMMYTDGVTEARNAGQEEFGLDRMREILRQQSAAPVGEILATLEAALTQFIGSAPQHDDITLVIAGRV